MNYFQLSIRPHVEGTGKLHTSRTATTPDSRMSETLIFGQLIFNINSRHKYIYIFFFFEEYRSKLNKNYFYFALFLI
jgi:hypothetical protein